MEIQISRLIGFNIMTWRNGIKIKNEALRFYLSIEEKKPYGINNKKTVHKNLCAWPGSVISGNWMSEE